MRKLVVIAENDREKPHVRWANHLGFADIDVHTVQLLYHREINEERKSVNISGEIRIGLNAPLPR